jgi:hypothetical protein
VKRRIVLQTLVALSLAIDARAQTATIAPRAIPAAPSWAGWAQCQVDMQGTGYTDRQTHTWVLSGGAPTMQGVFAIHPATWSAVGSGSAERTSGSQRLRGEWTTNVAGVNAPLAITTRASDKRIAIRPWHDRLGVSTGIKGTEQATIATVRAPAPTPLAFQAWESTFPTVEGNDGSIISGSSTLPTNATTAPMQPAGATRTTSCTWQFGEDPAALQPPPAPPAIVSSNAPATTPAPPGGAVTASSRRDGSAKTMTASTGCTQPGPTVIGQPLVTPGEVEIAWQRHGAGPPRGDFGVPIPWGTHRYVTYRVSRPDLGATPLQDINAAILPPGAAANSNPPVTFAHRAPLDHRVSYTYIISAHFAHEEVAPNTRQYFDDGCGITQVSITAPRPRTPDLANVTTGAGRVDISWTMAAQGQSGFVIFGDGLPQQGTEYPAHATRAEISGLPPGNHTWLLAPFWDAPSGRMIDVSTGRPSYSDSEVERRL